MPRPRPIWVGAGVLVVLAFAALIAWQVHDHGVQSRLLKADPDKIAADPALVRYAEGLAKPAYASHCASCHGDRMQGQARPGAPSLNDGIWLYGSGGVGEIERTVLYGIRSGHSKARNVTDMPPLGRNQQVSRAETADVARFVLSFTRPGTADTATLERGSKIFQGKGVCYDCHSGDARGNPDYGAPDLTDKEWLYGGDFASVFSSIYDGRHGLCPAFIGKLKPAVIRALAVYINTVSHKPAKAPPHV